MLGASSLKVM